MPKGIPLTEEQLHSRRKEIFDAAIKLFLKQGFYETSMREVAAAAQVGKSTLYDYFPSKEEIIIAYFTTEIQKITKEAQQIVQQDLSISEKVRRIVRMHLGYLVQSRQIFLKLSIEAQRLSLDSQNRIQVARHAYQDMLRELIEEGIRHGEFRPVNSLFAARSIFTLLSTVVYTTRPTGTPEEMLEEALGILFTGIQA